MSAPLGIGILGTGIMGRRFLSALQAGGRWQAVSMWDPQPAAVQAALALAPAARAAADVSAVVNDPAVRLVYVASPPAFHRAGVEAALAAGRACLCEKPLAASVAEAQALRGAVVRAGLPFAVNFPFASSTPARRLAALVRQGELGTLQQARIRVRFAQWPRPWQAGASDWLAGPGEGGFTREVLSHFVFLALRLFGPATVAAVRLQREPGRAEHALQARLEHAGIAVEIDAAVAGDIADDNRFEITGSAGTAVLSGWSRLEHAGQVTEHADGLANLLRTLADPAARDDAEAGPATVHEALAVVLVIEALLLG